MITAKTISNGLLVTVRTGNSIEQIAFTDDFTKEDVYEQIEAYKEKAAEELVKAAKKQVDILMKEEEDENLS